MQATGTTNRFETNNNVVVQNFAEGASSVDGNASGAPPPEQIWWYPATNTPGYLVLAAVDGIMETVNALRAHYDDVRVNIVWSQGENEAKRIVDGRSTAEIYKEATLEVFDYLRTHVDATFPIYIDEIGSSEFVGSEDRWNAGHPIIRAVQQQIAAEHDDIFIGAVSEDLPLQDRVHITDNSYEIVGARLANYIGYTDGLTDTITGPRPTPDPDQIVDPTDTAPQTVGEVFAVQAGAVNPTVAGNLLLNDTDVDGDVLVVGQVIGSNGSSAVYGNAINVLGTYGHLVIDRTGGFTYVVDDNAATRSIAEGATATETFTYIVSDGRGGRTPATLSIEVTGRNDAPVANDDVATAAKTDYQPARRQRDRQSAGSRSRSRQHGYPIRGRHLGGERLGGGDCCRYDARRSVRIDPDPCGRQLHLYDQSKQSGGLGARCGLDAERRVRLLDLRRPWRLGSGDAEHRHPDLSVRCRHLRHAHPFGHGGR